LTDVCSRTVAASAAHWNTRTDDGPMTSRWRHAAENMTS